MTQNDELAIQVKENIWDGARRLLLAEGQEDNRPITDRVEMMASGYLRDMDREDYHLMDEHRWAPYEPIEDSSRSRTESGRIETTSD